MASGALLLLKKLVIFHCSRKGAFFFIYYKECFLFVECWGRSIFTNTNRVVRQVNGGYLKRLFKTDI